MWWGLPSLKVRVVALCILTTTLGCVSAIFFVFCWFFWSPLRYAWNIRARFATRMSFTVAPGNFKSKSSTFPRSMLSVTATLRCLRDNVVAFLLAARVAESVGRRIAVHASTTPLTKTVDRVNGPIVYFAGSRMILRRTVSSASSVSSPEPVCIKGPRFFSLSIMILNKSSHCDTSSPIALLIVDKNRLRPSTLLKNTIRHKGFSGSN
mmetsp:Transcript_126/g.175  ORF Transcript_126/g.175 Transcript_126/m.175 type:complete len:208 (-) Transcript_126:90-713(-)